MYYPAAHFFRGYLYKGVSIFYRVGTTTYNTTTITTPANHLDQPTSSRYTSKNEERTLKQDVFVAHFVAQGAVPPCQTSSPRAPSGISPTARDPPHLPELPDSHANNTTADNGDREARGGDTGGPVTTTDEGDEGAQLRQEAMRALQGQLPTSRPRLDLVGGRDMTRTCPPYCMQRLPRWTAE